MLIYVFDDPKQYTNIAIFSFIFIICYRLWIFLMSQKQVQWV